jgi:hypothetical protein
MMVETWDMSLLDLEKIPLRIPCCNLRFYMLIKLCPPTTQSSYFRIVVILVLEYFLKRVLKYCTPSAAISEKMVSLDLSMS